MRGDPEAATARAPNPRTRRSTSLFLANVVRRDPSPASNPGPPQPAGGREGDCASSSRTAASPSRCGAACQRLRTAESQGRLRRASKAVTYWLRGRITDNRSQPRRLLPARVARLDLFYARLPPGLIDFRAGADFVTLYVSARSRRPRARCSAGGQPCALRHLFPHDLTLTATGYYRDGRGASRNRQICLRPAATPALHPCT